MQFLSRKGQKLMPASNQTKPPLQLFYSYSHRDEEFRNELELHLWGLKRQGIVSGWSDRKISAGTEWSKEISRNLESAHIILLLISPNFIASEYCYDKEMTRAMERHDAGEARVIPIIIRDVDNWQAAPFGRLQAVPKDGKPVNKWDDKDEAWVDVTRSVRLACKEMQEILLIQDPLSFEENSFKPERETITASGKIVEILNPSDENLKSLTGINSVSTEIPYGQVAGVHGNRMPPDRQGTQRNIDEVLDVMDRAGDEQGETVDELRAGGMSISRIDLLIKKAILLQDEAEESHLNESVPEEKRNAAHRALLKESYDLLRQANKLDPTNTEVLLYMAQLLMVLTPDDEKDEKRLLNRIRKLHGEPKNETEEFRLARASYLLAVTSHPPDRALLREARAVFDRLEQTKWVEQCNELLKSSGALEREEKGKVEDLGFVDLWKTVKSWRGIFSQPKTGAQAPTPLNPNQTAPAPEQAHVPQQPQPAAQPPASTLPVVQAPPPASQPQQPPTPVQPVAPAQFMPFGQWQIQVNDAIGSTLYINFIPNGVCFGTQFSQGIGHIQFNGRWGYNPYNRLLQLQGLINGIQPFMLNIIIHGPRNNGFYGVGSDGYAYFLSAQAMQ